MSRASWNFSLVIWPSVVVMSVVVVVVDVVYVRVYMPFVKKKERNF